MLLAMMAQNNNIQGGGSEMVYDEEEEQFVIKAKAICFPMLVHEIVKGLYEIVGTQGFGQDQEQNKAIIGKVDKLSNEPRDLQYGKFIYDELNNLFVESNIEDLRVRELFFSEVYKLEEEEFVEFIENLINKSLTSAQKQWATNEMRDIEKDLKKDDTGLEGLDENARPYTDIEVTNEYIIREFNANIDPIELKWHRDREDRIVEIVGNTDWKIQLEDQLPTSINESIFIPKGQWHRVIKGNGTLTLKINKK